jgi:hypothetical protein
MPGVTLKGALEAALNRGLHAKDTAQEEEELAAWVLLKSQWLSDVLFEGVSSAVARAEHEFDCVHSCRPPVI